VAVSTPVAGAADYFDSTGQLLRLVDADGDGVADGPGTVLFDGLPGTLTALHQAGPYVLATSSGTGVERISFLHTGATPASPMTLAGSINFTFPPDWEHTTYALAVRPTPGQPGAYDIFFNVGSEHNGITTDAQGHIVPDPTTETAAVGGLVAGTLNGDSIYRVTLRDNNGTPAVSNLTQIATGLRNAASMAIDPATGDFYFADNGIDGIPDLNEAWSTDTLDKIAAADIGASVPNFGFPYTYTLTTTTPGGTGPRINSAGGVPPLAAFQPLVDPNLPVTGSESEGASGFALSPPGFPPGLNHGVFIGFHGQFNQGGIPNEENPLLYVDPATGRYFDFISNDLPNIGHLDAALSTADSLFLSDLSSNGDVLGSPGQGVIYQIKAVDHPPTLAAVPDQTTQAGSGSPVVSLSATDPDGDPLTYSAQATNQSFYLKQALGLYTDGNYYTNWGGRGEKWVQGAGGLWYFILPDGGLYRWDGNGTASGSLVATLDPNFNADPTLLTSAQDETVAYHFKRTLGLYTDGNYYTNWGGRNEKWIRDTGGVWYFILPDGGLYRWDGSSHATGMLVAQFSPRFNVDPTLLTNAQAAPAAIQVNGSTLTITPQAGFTGAFYVTATAEDGWGGTDSKTFRVTVNDHPPTLAAIPDQSMSAAQGSLAVALSASDPDEDPLSFSAQADTQEYHYKQALGLYTDGNYYTNWGGRGEKWVQGAGGFWYFILPDGGLYHWDGSGTASGTLIAQLDPADNTDPTRLTDAQPGQGPASLSLFGSTLTITPNTGFTGVFFVTATVSDGTTTDSKTFKVTVG
jgi:hypothetical protein